MATKIVSVQKSNSRKSEKTGSVKPTLLKLTPEKTGEKYSPTKKQLAFAYSCSREYWRRKNYSYRTACKEYEVGSTL